MNPKAYDYEGDPNFNISLHISNDSIIFNLVDKNKDEIDINIYEGSFTIEKIKQKNEFLNEYKTVEKLFSSFTKRFDMKKYSISLNEGVVNLKLNYKFDIENIEILFEIPKNENLMKEKLMTILKNNVSKLNKESKEMKEEISMLNRENKEVKEKISQLSQENKELKEEISKLKKGNYEKVENSTLKKENSDEKGEILILKKENNDLKERINWLEEFLDKNKFLSGINTLSIMLSEREKNDLFHMTNKTYKNFKLLWSARKHGDSAKTFHQLCDNMGPTVTIIFNSNGKKFGAYIENSWNSSNYMQKISEGFFFTLDNGYGGSEKVYQQGMGQYCHSGLGPAFGNGTCFYISDHCLVNKSKFAKSCSCGLGYNTVNWGCNEFIATEVEVYSVS